jgi:hypothetical protein
MAAGSASSSPDIPSAGRWRQSSRH